MRLCGIPIRSFRAFLSIRIQAGEWCGRGWVDRWLYRVSYAQQPDMYPFHSVPTNPDLLAIEKSQKPKKMCEQTLCPDKTPCTYCLCSIIPPPTHCSLQNNKSFVRSRIRSIARIIPPPFQPSCSKLLTSQPIPRPQKREIPNQASVSQTRSAV